jgi:hypothetical protein
MPETPVTEFTFFPFTLSERLEGSRGVCTQCGAEQELFLYQRSMPFMLKPRPLKKEEHKWGHK